mmetsp:Transcript_36989/g.92739  ORF Transcript_36989/g.92739 Transcript_36989/m.92739 type:complete len:263 (-) Transcript_36989:1105-1893(-)
MSGWQRRMTSRRTRTRTMSSTTTEPAPIRCVHLRVLVSAGHCDDRVPVSRRPELVWVCELSPLRSSPLRTLLRRLCPHLLSHVISRRTTTTTTRAPSPPLLPLPPPSLRVIISCTSQIRRKHSCCPTVLLLLLLPRHPSRLRFEHRSQLGCLFSPTRSLFMCLHFLLVRLGITSSSMGPRSFTLVGSAPVLVLVRPLMWFTRPFVTLATSPSSSADRGDPSLQAQHPQASTRLPRNWPRCIDHPSRFSIVVTLRRHVSKLPR